MIGSKGVGQPVFGRFVEGKAGGASTLRDGTLCDRRLDVGFACASFVGPSNFSPFASSRSRAIAFAVSSITRSGRWLGGLRLATVEISLGVKILVCPRDHPSGNVSLPEKPETRRRAAALTALAAPAYNPDSMEGRESSRAEFPDEKQRPG